MTNKEILILLATALGELDCGWEVSSGHDKAGAFTIVRYSAGFKMGELRRAHSLIEDLLSEQIGPGDRVR